MHVALSYISVEQAWENLKASGQQGFDQTKAAAEALWRAKLDRFTATGGSRDDMIKFYTALYHTFMAPTTWSEAGGRYLG